MIIHICSGKLWMYFFKCTDVHHRLKMVFVMTARGFEAAVAGSKDEQAE